MKKKEKKQKRRKKSSIAGPALLKRISEKRTHFETKPKKLKWVFWQKICCRFTVTRPFCDTQARPNSSNGQARWPTQNLRDLQKAWSVFSLHVCIIVQLCLFHGWVLSRIFSDIHSFLMASSDANVRSLVKLTFQEKYMFQTKSNRI